MSYYSNNRRDIMKKEKRRPVNVFKLFNVFACVVCVCVSAIKCLTFVFWRVVYCNYSPRRVRHLYFHFFVSAASFDICSVVVVSFVSGVSSVVCPALILQCSKTFSQAAYILCMYWFLARCSVASHSHTHAHIRMQMHTPVCANVLPAKTQAHQMRRRRCRRRRCRM